MRSYMISSPPQEAEHIRGKTLTPESPKPLHVPSPSNIPILEDPAFHDSGEMTSTGTPVSNAYGQPQAQPLYPEAVSHASSLYAPASQAAAAAAAAISQPATYGNGAFGSQVPNTSIQTFPSQNQAPSSYDPNAYATHQAQSQPHGEPSNGGPGSHYASQSYSSEGQSELSSIPAPANLPPRPPAQDKYATNPNFNPNDDIRSFHPHSQPVTGQYRGGGQSNAPAAAGIGPSSTHGGSSNQSPNALGYGPRSSVDLSEGGDDEDRRWPPEINRLYEAFLEEERKYVTDGRWDQFPNGSRLFIGEPFVVLDLKSLSNESQETCPPRRSRNATSTIASSVMGSSPKSRSNKHTDSYNSWTPSRLRRPFGLSRARVCAEGRCVSGASDMPEVSD